MKFSKNIYLNDSEYPDNELQPLAQKQLRDRLRTGHILHTILGEVTANSLHDFAAIPESQRMEALLDIIQHHKRMQAHMTLSEKPAKQDLALMAPVETPLEDKGTAPKNKMFKHIPGV